MADASRISRAASTRGGDRRLRRARLLFAGAQSARLREGDRAARRQFPDQEAELARPAGRRRLYGGGDSGDRLRPPAAPVDGNIARDPGAAARRSIDAVAQAKARIAAARRRSRPPPRRRLRPGADGHRRDDLPARAIPIAPPARSARTARRRAPAHPNPFRAAAGRRKPEPRREGAVFFALRADGAFLARRRPPHGLLASTLELPGTAWTGQGPGDGWPTEARSSRAGAGCRATVEQVFTHFALRLTVYAATFDGGAPTGSSGSRRTRSARPVFPTSCARRSRTRCGRGRGRPGCGPNSCQTSQTIGNPGLPS